MKKLLTLCLLISLGSYSAFAQPSAAPNEKYIANMDKLIKAMDTTKTIEGNINLQNSFERIASKETSEWLPVYYQAFLKVLSALSEKDNDKRDAILDATDKLAEQALARSGDKSEILCIQAMSDLFRIQADPMTRGQVYGIKATNKLKKAMELNPENPRATLMMGQNIYYTPAQFGGGKEKAMPLILKAKDQFEKSHPQQLWPDWGRESLKKMLENDKK